MVEIVYNETLFSCADGETVLDTLLRHNADIPYSRQKGTCLTCLVKATEGDVPEQAQKNIRPSLAGQGYFLACQCPSAAGLSIPSGDGARSQENGPHGGDPDSPIHADPFDFMDLRSAEREGETARPDGG